MADITDLVGRIHAEFAADQRIPPEQAPEEQHVSAIRKQVALFVDRSSQQWIVRDPEGCFWLVPSTENGWDRREPYYPLEETVLEPVPAHYKDMLDLPF